MCCAVGSLKLDHRLKCFQGLHGALKADRTWREVVCRRVLDTTTRTAYGRQALWWSAAALAVAATRMSTRKKVALSALESRLSGKAVAREGAGYGLAMAAVLSCDWDLAGQLLSHSDAKVCAGAVLGCHNARNHMPESLSEANQILQPVFERIRLLANDPRKDVSKAAAVAVKQW